MAFFLKVGNVKKVIADNIEVRDDQPLIETLAESGDFSQELASEVFMNELLEIEVSTTTDENAPPWVMLNVNGVAQPIRRGYPIKVKRKYVEVLARMKETKYTQMTPNPMEPENIVMDPRTGYVYPFTVLHDPNPRGRGWLDHIKAEPA